MARFEVTFTVRAWVTAESPGEALETIENELWRMARVHSTSVVGAEMVVPLEPQVREIDPALAWEERA